MWRFFRFRDDVFNRLMRWLMTHCHCYCSTFYELCDQYHVSETIALFNEWKRWRDN